jgi:hypothetical protein
LFSGRYHLQAELTKTAKSDQFHLMPPMQFTLVCTIPSTETNIAAEPASGVLFTDGYCARNATANLAVGTEDLTPQDSTRYLGQPIVGNSEPARVNISTSTGMDKSTDTDAGAGALLAMCEAKCRRTVGCRFVSFTALRESASVIGDCLLFATCPVTVTFNT